MTLLVAVVAAGAVWFLVVGGPEITIALPGAFDVGLGLAAGAFGVMAGLPVLPLMAACGGAPFVVRRGLRRMRQRRSRSRIGNRWPDFLGLVRSRIAAGEPLPDAVSVAARSLGGDFGVLERVPGRDFETTLLQAQERFADSTADRVLTTVRLAASTGGSQVDALLAALASSLADELRVRRLHEAAVTEQQMTAGVALVAPWLILMVSLATNPQASAEFGTQAGRTILVVGAVATGLGYTLSRRAARLSQPPRLFR